MKNPLPSQREEWGWDVTDGKTDNNTMEQEEASHSGEINNRRLQVCQRRNQLQSGGQEQRKVEKSHWSPHESHTLNHGFLVCTGRGIGSLGRATTNEHQSPGPFREITAAWLREQGDWDGSKAIGENGVLLERRAFEIARAEAQLDLQQAHENGTVNDYLQSLQKRGHVGLANAGLTILNARDQSMWGQDRRQHQDQVNIWIAWLDWAVRFVLVMGGQRYNVEFWPAWV